MSSAFTPLRFFLAAAFAGLGLGGISSGRAATTLTDLHLQGTGNQVESGAELTITSGGTLTGATGSVVDLFHATVSLPGSLSLKDLILTGTGNQVQDGATLTLLSGASFTATSGSTVNLGAASVTFPTTVVLTTGSQTLTGKTLVSPVISSLSAAPTTDLTLAAGSGGVTLTLGQGSSGSATFSGPVAASNLTIASAKVFTVANSLTLSGTDSSTLNIGTGGTLRSGAYTNVGTNVRLYGAVGDGVTDDAPAIATAISAAGINGLVLFPAGDYAVNTKITEISPLAGQTLKFIDGAILRKMPTGTFDGGVLIKITANDVTIDGAIFAGRPVLPGEVILNGGTEAILVEQAQRVTLIRCTGSALLARLALFTRGSHYGRVIDCVSPGTGPTGYTSNHLEFNDSNYCLAQGNHFYGGGASACEIYQNSGNQIIGTRVIDNVFSEVGVHGVNLYGSIGAIVSRNVFRLTGNHAIFITNGEIDTSIESQANTIDNNYFEDCGTIQNPAIGPTVPIMINGPGNQVRNNTIICTNTGLVSGNMMIIASTGDDVNISGNLISGGRNGILVDHSVRRARVESNTIINVGHIGSGSRGIEIYGHDSEVYQNTVIDNRALAQRGLGFGALVGTGATGNIFSKNTYINATIDFLDNSSGNTPDGQIVSTVPTGKQPIVVTSTTQVSNLNASLLGGATFASPGAIGSTTPSTGSFTNLQTSGQLIVGDSGVFGRNGAFQGTTPASSSTVGTLLIGNGVSSQNVAIGGGSIVAGSEIAVGNILLQGNNIRLSNGRQWNLAFDSSSLSLSDATGGGTPLKFFGNAITQGKIAVGYTTNSTSVSSGALTVAGGLGLAGDQFIGGSLNLPGGGVLAGAGGNLSLTAGGADQDIVISPSGGGRILLNGPVGLASEEPFTIGNQVLNGTLAFVSGGGISGVNGLSLTAGGTNQNITLTPSGTGLVTTPAAFRSSSTISTIATTASTSASTGALVVAGGFGLGGDLFMGGSLNFTGTGLISSGGSLAFNAGGSNQNITLTPSGSGILTTAAPFSASGAITTTATTASTSAATGALVVAGGFGLAGDQYLGGSLNFSGPGIVTTGGSLTLSAGGTDQGIALTPSGTGTVTTSAPISTTATTASTSPSTGALVVAGGFGLAGNQYLGGSLNLSGGASLAGSAGALTFTAGGTDQNITLLPSGAGRVVVTGSLALTGNQTLGGSLSLSGGGSLNGSSGSLSLTASGANQNITLAPSGSGVVTTPAAFIAGGNLSTTATTGSTSTATGALVVGGGFGLGGDLFMGGSLNFAGAGRIASGSSLTLTAGGSNQNITLTPSGSGIITTAAPFSAAGAISTTATTASTSTSTGALIVAGGLGLAGDQYLGGSLNFSANGVLTTGGSLALSAGGTNQNITLTPSGTGVLITAAPFSAAGPISTSATTASTSPSTGALVVAGGFGLAGDQHLGGTLNLAGGGTLVGSAGALALAAAGTNKDITITPSGSGRVIVAGSFGLNGDQTLGGSLNLSGGGALAGSAGSLSLTAGGANQNITLAPSGSGVVTTPAALIAGGALTTTATTASTSTSTGALVVAGGFGLGGDLFMGGSLNFAGAGRIASGSSLTLTAGGSNQNITLTPSGSGILTTAAPFSAAGPISASATTASTSTSTGALVVAGGLGLAGDQYLGGSLNFSANGVLTTGGSLSLAAGGTNQNITLTPSGTGSVTLAGPVSVAGNQTVSGSLTLSGGSSIAGTTGALTLAAAGTNQNITLAPSGTGSIVMTAPVTFSGNQTFTGALALSGGGSLAGTAGSVDITAGGSHQNITLTPSGTGGVAIAGPLSVNGNQTLAGALAISGGGTLGGSSGALTLAAAGTNQNVTLTPSGNGSVALSGPVTATGSLTVSATTPSTSTANGALVVAGGFGLAGNQYLGGSLNLPGGASVAASSGALTLAAGGTNQNITLTPSGSGILTTAAPFSTAGALSTSAITASTSTSTGALVVAGGFGLAGDQYLGGALNLSGGGTLGGSAGALSLAAGGTNKDITLTPSGTGRIVFAGPVTFPGNQTFTGTIALSGGGTVAGSSGSIALTAGGTNQSITLTPSGSGQLSTSAPFSAGGPITIGATTASTSTSTGALIVAGGFGLAGNQFLGGSLNLSGGGSLAGSAGALELTAGGTNQNITLTPSGSGGLVVAGPVSASGPLTLSSTTNSTSTSTGALVVSGGAAFQKATSFGDDLLLTPTASTAATVRLSGTAIADVPGLWFRDGGTPTSTNVTLSSSAFTTILNGPSSGSLSLRVGNTNYLTLNATSATLQTIPLRVISASASTSTTTGSATFAGGIGVSGRTSTGSLSVGAGPTVSAILSVTASLDFPAIVANGGVQDLTVAVAGATIGNDVRIVEAGGSFAEAGLILRGIVSATGTVTVRATNVTTVAINPTPMSYRVTVTKF